VFINLRIAVRVVVREPGGRDNGNGESIHSFFAVQREG
jgi:hypothetical protein